MLTIERLTERWRFVATVVTFTIGAAGAINEIFIRDDQRLSTLAFICGLMGLPAFLPPPQGDKR